MPEKPIIREACSADVPAWARLRAALWPEATVEEHRAELGAWLWDGDGCSLVAEVDGRLVAFLEGQLRSHADGCETSPVAYLEGWYVEEAWRRRGVGGALVERFERWARERGCRELASDTWLDNPASQAAHRSLGFEEVDRVVTYRKTLGAPMALGPRARPPLAAGVDAARGTPASGR